MKKKKEKAGKKPCVKANSNKKKKNKDLDFISFLSSLFPFLCMLEEQGSGGKLLLKVVLIISEDVAL